ncbi:hypothetical protein [Cohnella luojiensis]|uniref:Uncharacterized protein n=1 Tax=Cohnella luojiensis TaxID=652876 RepID=A0A4Y8M6P3_9BACL|nr:hypothetical protein [Cohnella luojiensis]TFE31640.1 hypothetical protein E2980_00745 [Cohnella luojiensis]
MGFIKLEQNDSENLGMPEEKSHSTAGCNPIAIELAERLQLDYKGGRKLSVGLFSSIPPF